MARAASWFRKLFPRPLPVIGVVHLPPLPGLPGARGVAHALQRALADARLYVGAGVDGIIVENFGDAPFCKGPVEPHTIAALARIACALKDLAAERPVGVNVLRNDALGALGVAVGAGLDFVRVNVLAGVAITDQGLIEGDAARLIRYRAALAARVAIFADLRVKHAAPLRAVALDVEVEELAQRAHADAILLTGECTGSPPTADYVANARRAAGSTPVLVASGVDRSNIHEFAASAHGFVVGTALKLGGRTTAGVDARAVRALLHARDRAADR